jgi:hypothetical protein
MFFGVWCAISIFPTCIVAGIWQIAAGFAMIVIEVSHPKILVEEVSDLRYSFQRSVTSDLRCRVQ